MPKVKYDVSDVEVMSFQQPKPGLYKCKVEEMDHGPSKAGKPQFKVVFKVQDGEFKGSNLFHYVPSDPSSPGYFRLAELATAFGLRAKGVIVTEKMVGTTVNVRVKSDTYEGEYRARVGSVLPMKGEDAAEEDLDDEDLDEEEGEDEEVRYLPDMTLAELRAEAKERGINVQEAVKGRKTPDDKKDGLIDALESANDVEVETEEEVEAGDDYDEWSVDELKDELKDRGLRVAGKQTVLIGRLRKDDESDEDPFGA